jgi:hypothetical protein
LKLVPARADRVAQGARLEFKPQYSKKKEKKKNINRIYRITQAGRPKVVMRALKWGHKCRIRGASSS